MAEAKVKALKEDIQRLQGELEEQQRAASSYNASAARGPNRPLMYVKLHTPSLFAAAKMAPAAMKHMACAAPTPAVAPAPATPGDKGKTRAEQPLPTMNYELSLSYNDDEYDSGEERREIRA